MKREEIAFASLEIVKLQISLYCFQVQSVRQENVFWHLALGQYFNTGTS